MPAAPGGKLESRGMGARVAPAPPPPPVQPLPDWCTVGSGSHRRQASPPAAEVLSMAEEQKPEVPAAEEAKANAPGGGHGVDRWPGAAPREHAPITQVLRAPAALPAAATLQACRQCILKAPPARSQRLALLPRTRRRCRPRRRRLPSRPNTQPASPTPIFGASATFGGTGFGGFTGVAAKAESGEAAEGGDGEDEVGGGAARQGRPHRHSTVCNSRRCMSPRSPLHQLPRVHMWVLPPGPAPSRLRCLCHTAQPPAGCPRGGVQGRVPAGGAAGGGGGGHRRGGRGGAV